MCVSCSVVSDSFAAPRAIAHQAPVSVQLSRQEYWSGLPFPSPGDLADPLYKIIVLNEELNTPCKGSHTLIYISRYQ